MKVEQTENYLKIENNNYETLIDSDSVIVKNKNKTLEDLRQKLINQMFHQKFYQKEDIEILKILFDEK